MRKVLIGTPCRGEVTKFWLESLLNLTNAKHLYPDIEFGFCVMSGTSVNFARNQIAHHGKINGFDDLVFVDSDLGDWFPAILRLLDHPCDVVAGLYTAKRLGARPWFSPKDGVAINPETGLLECTELATGFMKINLKTILPKLEAAYPESAFLAMLHKDDPEKRSLMYEYFPMGVIGPNSFEVKLQDIKAVLELYYASPSIELDVAVSSILDRNDPGHIRGEDYYFSYRCVHAGIPIYADTKLLLPHYDGSTSYPPNPQEILALAEKLKGAA